MKQFDFASLQAALIERVFIVRDEFKRKGVGHYKVPILLGVVGSAFIYMNVYSPVFIYQRRVSDEISSLKTQAEVAEVYRPARAKELAAVKRFPKLTNKEWLSKTMQRILSEENVVPRAMDTPTEADMGEYVLMTMQISLMPMPFSTVAKVAMKIENSEQLLKITDCSLSREQAVAPGWPLVGVTMTVSTLMPKETTGNAG